MSGFPSEMSSGGYDCFSELLANLGDFSSRSESRDDKIRSGSPSANEQDQPEQPIMDDGCCDYVLNIDDPNLSAPVQRIEALVADFLEQLSTALPSTEREVEQVLRKETKTFRKLELRLTDRKKVSNDGTFGTYARFFPRGMGASIKPFAQFFRVADMAHEAMLDGLPATKRDLFYRDVQLFKKQSVVDKLVDDLAATIDTDRAHLNVRASPKGLVCGSGLSIHTVSGNIVHVTESEGTLIPGAEDIYSLDFSNDINWVLIVEKEAVFQTLRQLCLIQHPYWRLGAGIMITGKGYPDLATRELVKMLSDNLAPTVPIVALVDGDAYGLDIVSVYKFGSVAFRHEAYKLAAPRVECIGIWASALASFGIDRDTLIPISRADERKARSMLRRELPARWKRELMHMLHTRRKAEIEILSSVSRNPDEPHPLIRYLEERIWERILALALDCGSELRAEDDDACEDVFDEL